LGGQSPVLGSFFNDANAAHTDEEHVAVDALHAAARIYAGLALRLCAEDEGRGAPTV